MAKESRQKAKKLKKTSPSRAKEEQLKIAAVPEDALVRKYQGLVLIALLVLSLALAWFHHFIQDDAFISFIYSRSLVEGNGLTWFGNYVEGYTNFLWVLWIALGMELKIDPIVWSYLGGFLSYAAVIYCAWKLSFLIFNNYLPAILTIILLALNYTFSAYATGGLETMLQTALICAPAYFLYKIMIKNEPQISFCIYLSLLFAAATMTRMDTALPCAMIGLFALYEIYRRRLSGRFYLALCAPFIIIVGGWLAWKLNYYGHILPNSYYAKIGLRVSFNKNGLVFLYRFFSWYGLWPFFGLGIIILFFKKEKSVPGRRLIPLLVVVAVWCLYIIIIGGDFMEFRFMVPITPFLFILLAYIIYYLIGKLLIKSWLAASLIAIAILSAASIYHSLNFKYITKDKSLDSIPALSSFYGKYGPFGWGRIGNRLKEDLAGTDAILAMDAVGAIPFYSGLKTIDMWGLNDPYIARYGQIAPKLYLRPGHRRRATLDYLKQQKVNLIIGGPTITSVKIRNAALASKLISWVRNKVIPFESAHVGEATFVAMPIQDGKFLLMWYLTRTDRIDRAISEKGWQITTVNVPDVVLLK